MARKKKNEGQNNKKTKLILKGNRNGYLQNDTQIDFAVLSKKDALYKVSLGNLVLPIFNNDLRHYTPGFILKYVEKPTNQDYLLNHIKKVEQSLQQIDAQKIQIPKPRSKNKYCGVCRNNYQDYLEHIKSKQHDNKLEYNNFHLQIISLCYSINQKYQNQEIKRISSISTKINDEQNSTESFIDQPKININNQYVSLEIIN